MFIKKIACIDIWSGDYESLAKWYTEVLELTPVQTLALPNDTGVVFDIGGVLLYIGRHSEISGPSKDSKRIMVEFEVESVLAVYQKLQAKHVEFIQAPIEAPTGDMHVATAYDLDRNILQFVGGK